MCLSVCLSAPLRDERAVLLVIVLFPLLQMRERVKWKGVDEELGEGVKNKARRGRQEKSMGVRERKEVVLE